VPNLETYYAREPVGVARAPRGPAREIADIGGTEVPEAIAEAAGTASGIVAKWYEREGSTQYDTQRRLAWEEFNGFEARNFTDADSHDAAYESLKADVKGLAPTNKSGARKFQRWLDRISPYWDRGADEKKIRGIKFNNEKEYFRNIAAVGSKKDFAEARREARLLTQGAVDDKTRTPAQADSDYRKIMEVQAKRILQDTVATIVQQEGWEAAEKFLHDKDAVVKLVKDYGLEFQDVDAVIEDIETQVKYEKEKADQALTNKQTETEAEAYNRLQGGSLTVDWITQQFNAGNLSKADRDAYRKEMGGRKTLLDLDAYYEVRREIDQLPLDPEKVQQKINKYKGKKFDINVAKELTNKLLEAQKTDSLLASPAAKRGADIIDRLRGYQVSLQDKTADDYLERVQEIEYDMLQISNDFDQWLIKNPGVTDEEIEKKVNSLTKPIKEETLATWFSRILFEPRFAWKEIFKERTGFKHIAVNPDTGERMGSNDGVKWQPIP